MTTTMGSSAVQVVPWDTVNLMRPFFDKGPDAMGARLLDLSVLRGAWICSVDSSGNWIDSSGHGHTLTYNGNPTFNYSGLISYWDLDGTGDYFSWADVADNSITGTETTVAAAVRGLTWGGWFYPTETGTEEDLFSKWGAAAGQSSYRLLLDAADRLTARFSDDGTNFDSAVSSAISMDTWYFLAGRVRPGAFVDLFVGSPTGLVEYNQATAQLSIFNSTSDLCIGARHGGAGPFNGRCARPFLCAAACSDTQVNVLYQMTKRYFGH